MDITTCIFCGEICEESPTKRGWSSVGKYAKGLHFDCAEKVASQGRQLSPSPQTGEKDEAVVFRNALERIASYRHKDKTCSLEAQGYDELDCVRIGALDYLASIASAALWPSQPPPAQSDQEAAEKWADESIDPWRSSQETFLAGCNHVRGQQVELLNKLKAIREDFQWCWDSLHKEHTADHFNIPANAIHSLDTIIESLTARHPSPKQGSHD